MKIDCPACGEQFNNGDQVDICCDCLEAFGDCDGSCGDPECGNNHCQNCGGALYEQSCPECREPLPTNLWIGEVPTEKATDVAEE